MTLNELPNLALFTFKKDIAHYPPKQVWQKQFSTGNGIAKGLTIEYVAQAKKTPRGYTRGAFGIGGISGELSVLLVAQRKRSLQVR